MKHWKIWLLGCCAAAFTVSPVQARDIEKDLVRPAQVAAGEYPAEIKDIPVRGSYNFYSAAQVDTYFIIWYDFEPMDWQDWTRLDVTGQIDTFFHVDDFAGLGGGDKGGLVALEGERSMWCGARPDPADPYLCSWTNPPGYGTDWDQMLVSDPISYTGYIVLEYKGHFDSERNYDFTYVEYDAGGGDWRVLAAYDDVVDTTASHEFSTGRPATKLRFHFTSDAGWSDEDGIINTDGAAIIDSIVVSDDSGTIHYEDFESWPVGTKGNPASIWRSATPAPYGRYSGLAGTLMDNDPCNDNFGTQVVFFVGSPHQSDNYPGLQETPFCEGEAGASGLCQDEMVVSPVIDLTRYSTNCDEIQNSDIPAGELPNLGGVILRFSVMSDLPLGNLVFYRWQVRNVDGSGCSLNWLHRNYVYYSQAHRPQLPGDYIVHSEDISDLIEENSIQVGLGCSDMCDVFYPQYGDCAEHTPSPWFDDVRLYRYWAVGPLWSWRDLDLFQDNFPGDEADIESYIRADMADYARLYSSVVLPGDSVVVRCSSPHGGGIAEDANGPRVYMHVKCSYAGDPYNPKPDLAGPGLEGTYGNYAGDDGVWTVIQGERAVDYMGYPYPNRFMFDLNDTLFTRGYRIEYYFSAYDSSGQTSAIPPSMKYGKYFEWTCLPTLASDILLVDDFRGLKETRNELRHYYSSSFRDVLPPDGQPDRYDVNSAVSNVSNTLAQRAKQAHLSSAYSTIIWDSGYLNTGTITSGNYEYGSNDCRMLLDWMQNTEHDVGLWICGEGIAYDLSMDALGVELMTGWCGVEPVNDSYFDLTGGVAGGVSSPLVEGTGSGLFYHGGIPDTFYLAGGCPFVNSFDVLEKTEESAYALGYTDFGGQNYHAGIMNEKTNDPGYTVRTMWLGFSFIYVRDAATGPPLIRNHILKDVLDWMQGTTNPDITEGETPHVNRLRQNYPNPFNPSTTIRFDLKTKGNVTLRIYNVAGQMIKTLVDGVKDAGAHSVTWDGTNERGSKAASGIYFYKVQADKFEGVKKMVLLR